MGTVSIIEAIRQQKELEVTAKEFNCLECRHHKNKS